jgi:hypothetical protein
VTLHEADEVLLQDRLVPDSVHGDLGGEEEDPSPPPGLHEGSPHHHGDWELHGDGAELWVLPGANRTMDELDLVPDELEDSLIGEHHLVPVLGRPVPVLTAELQPGLHHVGLKETLPGCPPARHAKDLLTALPDPPQAEMGDLRNLLLDDE